MGRSERKHWFLLHWMFLPIETWCQEKGIFPPTKKLRLQKFSNSSKVTKKEKRCEPWSIWSWPYRIFLHHTYSWTWLWYYSTNDSSSPFLKSGLATPFISLSLKARVQILSLLLTSWAIVAKSFNSELTIFPSVHSNISKSSKFKMW